MTTVHDLMIQRECSKGRNSTGDGLITRGHALETGYFARESHEKLKALKARQRNVGSDEKPADKGGF